MNEDKMQEGWKGKTKKVQRLAISLFVGIIIPILLWLIPFTKSILHNTFELDFIHIFGIFGGGLTLWWTNARYQQSQKQLEQGKNFQILSKLNELYSKLVEKLSIAMGKGNSNSSGTTQIRNLISSISSSLDLHYPEKGERSKYAEQILNFQNMCLRNIEIAKTDLREAKFERADLQGTNLKEAELQRANLQGANLQRTNLGEANLQGAKLQGAKLQGAKLQEVKLQGANLQKAELQEANLQGAKLQRANLQRANLHGANLHGANLQKAELQGANLQRANLQRANLQRANLQRANLQRANLQRAKLQRANLQRANLQRAGLYEADLQGAYLQETDFSHAYVPAMNRAYLENYKNTIIGYDTIHWC